MICECCGDSFELNPSRPDFLCKDCYEYLLNDFEDKDEDEPSYNEFINDWDYKPDPIFHKNKHERKNNLYCGIELEIQGDNRLGVIQDNLQDNFFYYKHDGSLDEDTGIEIVSHPATYKYHLSHWKKMFFSLIYNGMNNLNNCGLHFHFNRNYFTNENIASLDCFINNNQDIVEKIGGRKILCHYFDVVYKRLSEWGKSNGDRHLALNLNNKDTIEIRFFASTDDYEVFIDRLKTVFALVLFCKKYNTICNNNLSIRNKFEKFLKHYKSYN